MADRLSFCLLLCVLEIILYTNVCSVMTTVSDNYDDALRNNGGKSHVFYRCGGLGVVVNVADDANNADGDNEAYKLEAAGDPYFVVHPTPFHALVCFSSAGSDR